jgi:uncharacterized protein (TIGR03089 family)
MHQQLHTQGHAAFLTYYDDISGERTELSYATFDNWVGKTANLLSEEFNAGRGSRVAVAVGGHWTAVVAAFACWRLGACVVPIPREQSMRLDEVLRDARVDVVIAWEDLVEDLGRLGGAPPDRLPVIAVGPGFGGRVTTGVSTALAYGDEVLAFADDYDDPDVTLEDPALLVLPPWSGRDAAILLHQTNLLAAALTLGAWGLAGDDRVLSTDPLSPVDGLVLGQLAPFAAGGATVLVRDLDPATFARKVRDERVTWALPPGDLLDTLRSGPADLGPLHGFLCPAGVPPVLRDHVEVCTGRRVLVGHGLAAATSAATLEPADLDDETRPWIGGRPGRYVGTPTVFAEVAARDGEISIRGPVVMAGHDGRQDLDEVAFAGGWLHTGAPGRVERGPDGRTHVFVDV